MIPQTFIADMKRYAARLSGTAMVELMELHNQQLADQEKTDPKTDFERKMSQPLTEEEINKIVERIC